MTTPTAKTIQIYLPTGEPRGIRIAEILSASTISFYCRGGGSEGKGELVEDGFVFHEGSKARMEVVTSAMSSVASQGEKLVSAGVLEETNDEYIFTQDYLFTSPGTTAAVGLGGTADGWVEWKDKDGSTLSEIHRDTNEADDLVDDDSRMLADPL